MASAIYSSLLPDMTHFETCNFFVVSLSQVTIVTQHLIYRIFQYLRLKDPFIKGIKPCLAKALNEYLNIWYVLMIKLCLMFLSLFSLLLSFSLFSFQDPKGDESRMLSLRLSGCPEERVWQESSEWLYLLLLSLPQSRNQSCSSGSKIMGVFIFAI